jgi:hypothetical protein
MSTLLDAQQRAVLLAVKTLAKPWSPNGGARMNEIADFVKQGPLITTIVLRALEREKFIVPLVEEGSKKIVRFYLNIYPPTEKK